MLTEIIVAPMIESALSIVGQEHEHPDRLQF